MKEKLNELTLDEKLLLLNGTEDWSLFDAGGKITKCVLYDGPSGVKVRYRDEEGKIKMRPSTAHPSLGVIGNSWDRATARLAADTIADECIEKGVDLLLAPGVNIKRTPLCGRNFEYISEDPYLAGVLAKEYIEGLQDRGVGACLKHLIANNREAGRFAQSSEIDERTLREIYLRVFEIALEAKPWSVMCSYNLLNGVYTSEHKKLLTDTLRGELGYDGTVFSDWGAVINKVNSLKAGIDVQEPYDPKTFDILKAAYESGKISEEEIEKSVTNILKLLDKIDKSKGARKVRLTDEERHQNAVKEAEEGIVLLKNDGILPLKKGKSAMVIGNCAEHFSITGGGSARVDGNRKIKILSDALREKGLLSEVEYHPGYQVADGSYVLHILNCTMQMAYGKDYCIVCVGNIPDQERENIDRTSLKMHRLLDFVIDEAAKVNENLIVVVYAGSAVDMSGWIDKARAVVFSGYGGQGINEAVAKILTAEVNPSGKLSETFPLKLEDTPGYPFDEDASVDKYTEGILVGYRHYDTKDIDVMFPFGYGLSYSSFEYSNLRVRETGAWEYEVKFDITNTSNIAGKEISQLYVRDVAAFVYRPQKELKAFSKDLIAPGETKEITFNLDRRDFAFWSTAYDGWHTEGGNFEILIGASSRDIRLKHSLKIGEIFIKY